MALFEVSLSEESKQQLYETLISTKPLEPDNHSIFKVTSPVLEGSFEASSMQEAATKFGHGLFYFNQLNRDSKEKPFTFECENVDSCQKREYQAFVILKGTTKKPLIVAKRVLKRSNNCPMNYQNYINTNGDKGMVAAATGATLDDNHDLDRHW